MADLLLAVVSFTIGVCTKEAQMEFLNVHSRKKISLAGIEANLKMPEYEKLYQFVSNNVDSGILQPMKNSGTNGKKPSLPMNYWINPPTKDYSQFTEELKYQLHPSLQNDYYLKNLKQYEKDRKYVQMLNEFFESNLPQQTVSLNERAYEIWQREKFMQNEGGLRILKNLGLSTVDLNIYETAEPIAYYTRIKDMPQNIIILENKDTFYSMRRHLISGASTICGLSVGTLIYGGGKSVSKAFRDFKLSVEPYLLQQGNQFHYFGDLDYEGIGIYQQLANVFEYSLVPFYLGYQLMLQKAARLELSKTKLGQKSHDGYSFWDGFDLVVAQTAQDILGQGNYIPQEILNIGDF